MSDTENIELTTMTFTASQLSKVPEPHREFFFSCCMATNEVNAALRLYMMAMESFSIAQKEGSYTILQVAYSSMTIAERNVAAKLYEVFHLLKEYARKTKKDRVTAFERVRTDAIDLINDWKEQPVLERIKWYRDRASHHYGFGDVKGLGELTRSIGADGDERTFIAVMHRYVGSSLYPMVDQLLIDKLVDDGRDPVEQNELDHQEIKELAKSFMMFHYNLFRVVWKFSGAEAVDTATSSVDKRLILKAGRSPLPVIFEDKDGPSPSKTAL
ncbi:hypothetical protein [Rhizobium pisi]|uniref:hypothetical protein n=1 Tax=Rhizobium pisi TaxID=574561 RepID=UPI003CFC37D6